MYQDASVRSRPPVLLPGSVHTSGICRKFKVNVQDINSSLIHQHIRRNIDAVSACRRHKKKTEGQNKKKVLEHLQLHLHFNGGCVQLKQEKFLQCLAHTTCSVQAGNVLCRQRDTKSAKKAARDLDEVRSKHGIVKVLHGEEEFRQAAVHLCCTLPAGTSNCCPSASCDSALLCSPCIVCLISNVALDWHAKYSVCTQEVY